MRNSLKSEEIMNIGRHVISSEAFALLHLSDTLDENFDRAVRLILDCHQRVILTGMGKAGHIARKIAATFASTGTPAFFVHPGEAAHGDLGMFIRGDLVIALSHSGRSDELINILPALHDIGTALIAITSQSESPLTKEADIVLLTGVEREADPRGQAPTTSAIAMLSLGDALAIAVSEARGFTKSDFLRFHPGGALGRQKLV